MKFSGVLLATAGLVFSTGTLSTAGQGIRTLLPDDGGSGERFGWSVARSGQGAVIGAIGRGDDFAGEGASGSVILFDWTTGEQLRELTPEGSVNQEYFGSSVDFDGDRVVVGAPFAEDDDEVRNGAVYVFDVGTGEQLFRFTSEDETVNIAGGEKFGFAVAMSGSRVVVSSVGGREQGGGTSGVIPGAYVYDVYTGELIRKLELENASNWNGFMSVAAEGNMALIGTPDLSGDDIDNAFLFDVTSGGQLFELKYPSDAVGFGASVALCGTTALVLGAPDSAQEPGAVYAYDVTTGDLLYTLTPEGDDSFWFSHPDKSLSTDGATALVKAKISSDGLSGDGVYVFDVTTGDVRSKFVPLPGVFTLGMSVDVAGSTALVGNPIDASNGAFSGAGYVYDLSLLSGADLNGDGVVNSADLAELLAAWGSGGPADLDGDGVTDAADLAILLAAWG